MDLKSGLPWWLIKNGLQIDYDTLEQDIETEVIIIGAGITGTLAAHFLCEIGVKCVVIDKRLAGTGSTSASTAQLQYEIDTLLTDLVRMRGTDRAVQSYHACLQSIYTLKDIVAQYRIDCGFEMKSSLYLASARKDIKILQKESELRNQYNLPAEFLDQQNLQSRFGINRPAALYNTCSAQMDAYSFCQKLLNHHLKNSGLKVYSHSEVSKVNHAQEQVVITTSKNHRIKASRMVCSPGYESQFFLKEKVMRLHSTYALVSRPLRMPLWNEECLIWETSRPYLYIRTTSDKRVIVGGEDEPFSNPERRDKLMEAKNKAILKKFHKLFPHIKLETDFYWCGTFAETEDGLPFIGEHPKHPNTYFALGYGGNGITFSVVAAEIIRDLYLGKANQNAGLFGFNR